MKFKEKHLATTAETWVQSIPGCGGWKVSEGHVVALPLLVGASVWYRHIMSFLLNSFLSGDKNQGVYSAPMLRRGFSFLSPSIF